MKWIKYIGHPVLTLSLFLLLLIESEHFGGFYLLYILMALPTGAPFAITALIGLISLFVGYKIHRQHLHPIKPGLYLLGYGLMVISLVLFFGRRDRLETFQLTIPTLTFIAFGICSLCFIVYTISLLIKAIERKENNVKLIS